MNKTVKYIIDIAGNAQEQLNKLGKSASELGGKVGGIGSMFGKLSSVGFGVQNIVGAVQTAVSAVKQFTEANALQQEAEAKLAQVMKNTMGASQMEIQGIKDLASAQQQLGVIGDEVQLSGAQELGTYLEKTESLKALMPVMNDMLAQQYGLNATQEQAVTIGSMMGKVMEGQVGALSRYGYKFDEAQEKVLKFGTEEQKVATLAEVIGQSVGGMNAALAATPEGKMQQLKNRFGDLKEVVGNMIVNIGMSLMPLADAVMNVIDKVTPVVRSFVGPINDFFGKIIGDTQSWKSYIDPVVNTFKNGLMPTFKAIFHTVGRVVVKVIDFVRNSELLKDVFGAVQKVVMTLYSLTRKLVAFLEKLFNNVVLPILNGIEKAYRWIKGTPASTTVAKQGVARPAGVQQQVNASASIGSSAGGSTAGSSSGSSAATSVATGGTRSTSINITLGNMVEKIVFEGGLERNARDLEEQVKEILLRTLYAAQAAAV